MRLNLARVRGANIPKSTWHRWLNATGISRDPDGCYGWTEYSILRDLVRALGRGMKVKQFIAKHPFYRDVEGEELDPGYVIDVEIQE